MKVFAIDPGSTKSAYCLIDGDTLRPLLFDKVENREMRQICTHMEFRTEDRSAIEMVSCYGKSVGRDVFETVRWIGRLQECLIRRLCVPPRLVYRLEEKLHICQTSKASDAMIRSALISRFARHDWRGGKGTKANPDWFYGFHADIWQAYAVAVTYAEAIMPKEEQ